MSANKSVKAHFNLVVFLFIATLQISCSSCGTQKATQEKTLTIQENIVCDSVLSVPDGGIIRLESDIDLNDKVVKVPKGVTFITGPCVIKNGTLIGDETIIKGTGAIFENVRIKGSWKVKNISTKMFSNLDYVNSLCDVFALASPTIKNDIYVESKNYEVSAKPFQGGLNITSNCHITIDGNIRLTPNGHQGCYVLFLDGCSNVIIEGNGCVYGDKISHTGTEGQWGHGINIHYSDRITIRNFSVKDCWGDCIYVGLESSNILIDNCKLDNGRRQGVSVTSANHVKISNCFITNISGSNPQYAIDIEPNGGCTVDNVEIVNVSAINCYGGFTMWRPDNAHIGSVVFRNCIVEGTQANRPVVLELADRVEMMGCKITSGDLIPIRATRVNELVLKNNVLQTTHKDPIAIVKCKKTVIKNNIKTI